MKKNIIKFLTLFIMTIALFTTAKNEVLAGPALEFDVLIKKVWNDDNNKYGKRPESVEIDVYSTRGSENELLETVILNESNNWQTTVTAPGYSHIDYVILEEKNKSEYYESSVTPNCGEECIITNTFKMTKINGKKTWVDEDNKNGKRPQSIKVYAMLNGAVAAEAIVDAANNWSYEFNLPALDDNKKENIYTIKEEQVENYTSKIEGYNIINTYTEVKNEEETPDNPEDKKTEKTPEESENNTENPETNDQMQMIILVSIGAILTFGLSVRQTKKLN